MRAVGSIAIFTNSWPNRGFPFHRWWSCCSWAVPLVAGGIALVWTDNFGAAIAAALVGFWPPLFWVMWVRNRRIAAMETLLPGALEQLADCLHSGQTLEQAAELMTVQTASPLKEEFGHCVQLLKMGQSPVGVMDRLSRRIPLPEFRLFATAVLVHRQTGGNLAQLTARLAVSGPRSPGMAAAFGSANGHGALLGAGTDRLRHRGDYGAQPASPGVYAGFFHASAGTGFPADGSRADDRGHGLGSASDSGPLLNYVIGTCSIYTNHC